jgi:hypothetical protein
MGIDITDDAHPHNHVGEEFHGNLCRQCGRRGSGGYTVTCGRSECQEAEYLDNKTRNKRKRTKGA